VIRRRTGYLDGQDGQEFDIMDYLLESWRENTRTYFLFNFRTSDTSFLNLSIICTYLLLIVVVGSRMK